MNIPLQEWSSSESALLELLSQSITDEMLEHIASVDYGRDVSAHSRALNCIREGIWDKSRPLDWYPKEVVRLISWCEPDSKGNNFRTEHLERAFACAILLRAGGDSINSESIFPENGTLAQLTASALTLGGDVPDAVFRQISFRLANEEFQGKEERPFFLLALVLLSIRLSWVTDDEMSALIDHLLIEERLVRESNTFILSNSRCEKWLLGLTNFDQKHDVWVRLAVMQLLQSPNPRFPKNQARLYNVGLAVSSYFKD